MKRLLIIFLLILGFQSRGQVDTLLEEDLRKAADIVFGELDASLYDNALINRSFTSVEITSQQLRGDYSQTHSINEFFGLYQDIGLAYADSTQMMNNTAFAEFIENLFVENERNYLDELIQPFGFVLHNISLIDSTKLNAHYFSKNGFRLIPTYPEQDYYQKKILKSGTLIELYPESGYTKGKIQYVPELISTSPDITNLSLHINVGNGFVPFNETNNLVAYNRTSDSLIGLLAYTYVLNQEKHVDTIQFYLTTKGEVTEKSNATYWDFVGTYNNSTGIKFEVGFLRACDNTTLNAKRPVIFVPPYRPFIQGFSMKKYFDQFNVDGLFNKLVEKGYDVIFIKLKPGHASLETAAQALSEYITEINELKQQEFPNESWENIVIGYSMGGQIARYCLKKMEYDHMVSGAPHHHTRLYIPFDSPHWGANIPLFAQAVYKDLKNLNIFAGLSYIALDDAASRDMSVAHINGSVTSIEAGGSGNPDIYHIIPGPTYERNQFMNALYQSFNHSLSITSDLRRTFPSFTRNISVSTGSNEKDYNELFALQPGELLFSQSAVGYYYGGTAYKLRRLYASKRAYDYPIFRNKEQMLTFLIPITYRNREYRTYYADEWDLAQGGYKDEFYDKLTGAVRVLRLGTFGLGQKYYDNHISFLPMVSSLAINKDLWQLGNMYYNLKAEGLMFKKFDYIPNQDESDTYGYPNLGHPSDHFNITPFEALYCDPQTYEHIKLQESISENAGDANNNNPVYLTYVTQFMLDEIEADEVYLQNKIIGKNHVQWDPNYTYTAWYRAKNKLTIGANVTPKTDAGAYVIEATGDITTYAGTEINIKPGFYAQNGATFHAYIAWDDCPRDAGKSMLLPGGDQESRPGTWEETQNAQSEDRFSKPEEIRIYPNPSSGEVNLVFPDGFFGNFAVFSYLGEEIVQWQSIPAERKWSLRLPKGHYLMCVTGSNGNRITKQIIIL